jgi:hypothetical protein
VDQGLRLLRRHAPKGNAKKHAREIHDGVRYPCPYAEDFDCDKTFTTLGDAEEHGRALHEKVKYACAVLGNPMPRSTQRKLMLKSQLKPVSSLSPAAFLLVANTSRIDE